MTTDIWNSNIYQQIYGFIYVLKSLQKKSRQRKRRGGEAEVDFVKPFRDPKRGFSKN